MKKKFSIKNNLYIKNINKFLNIVLIKHGLIYYKTNNSICILYN